MEAKSVILIGGPDSGKTNYVGRLWASIKERTGKLRAVKMPPNIEYVNETVEHLMKGKFAPRSETNIEDGRKEFIFDISNEDLENFSSLMIPDISGELWNSAVKHSELPEEWMNEIQDAGGALLFIRVHSQLNIQPPDWVTARNLLSSHKIDSQSELPTQVLLCELLRYLELYLATKNKSLNYIPRIAIIVSAWDRLDKSSQANGPIAFLEREFPLLAGRLLDDSRFSIKVFGLSILGGDLDDDAEFREKIQGEDISTLGSVTFIEEGKCVNCADITIPLSWVISS